ncbi:hypothetical protein BLNAU_11485 [Blattamonas nauphoetae]|uniref:Uncharacterized protein n=1 Tax=Blattamonas nauphoetae TaxID=2049346 RepID=A0ABQ9XSF9_9EUKA|nr:hypothetical protein BLNAU_11485 [Blattamonas nauphoetae]
MVLTTLARISLFPHLFIASNALLALFHVFERDPSPFTLLPSPIFPSSSPLQQYSGISFLSALTKKLRIVFSKFQDNLTTDPSHLTKYVQLTKYDPFVITRSLSLCGYSSRLPTFLLRATPPIEVDSEIIRELILFVKEALPTILTNISNIDNLIASLPSDSSPTTPSVSGIDTQMVASLNLLHDACEIFALNGWRFFVDLTFNITDPHKSSFQTIILDDQSFPDLIFNSLKITHRDIRLNAIIAIANIVVKFRWMRERFRTANLVGRMFETVDFVSLPLSESKILYSLTRFITSMLEPIGDDFDARLEQYRLIRVSVFEPTKQFITLIFRNSFKLILNDEDKAVLETRLCWIHNHIKNMELRSDEHDADLVSELVEYEMRTMVEMESEEHFYDVFQGMLNRTWEWNRDKRERQKRREVRRHRMTMSRLFALHSFHLVHNPLCSHLRLLMCYLRDVPADRKDAAFVDDGDGTVDNAVLEMEGDEERDSVELESDMNQSKQWTMLIGPVRQRDPFLSNLRMFPHLAFNPLSPSRVQPIPLTHSLPNQPQLRLTTPPSRHPPPLTQPALRRLARLSPVFTCGTRGGRFVGSDSESEMTLSVDEALVVFCSSWTQVSSESRALG